MRTVDHYLQRSGVMAKLGRVVMPGIKTPTRYGSGWMKPIPPPIEAALQHRFGRRSERIAQLAKKDKPGKATPHGRAALPEHLPRCEVVHDLTEAEKLCPCCGRPRVCIGVQTAEQLDLQPAHFFVLRTSKKSYACQHCDPNMVAVADRIQTAGPAEVGPLAKGLCGPGLLAHVLTAKFADHTPLHRLAGQLARSGVSIAESTLGDWVAGAADLLQPLCKLMHERLLLSRVIHGDDTNVKLRVLGSDRTHKSHLWAGIGDLDYPYVIFDFTATYTAAGPEKYFKGFKGYLQADALAQYEGLYGEGKVQHCCCWAHARRKFVAAAQGGEVAAQQAVERIGQLYAIERELPPLLGPFPASLHPRLVPFPVRCRQGAFPFSSPRFYALSAPPCCPAQLFSLRPGA